MSDTLKFQIRLLLAEEFARVARSNPADPSLAPVTAVLSRHNATLKSQFDAFADYVAAAETSGDPGQFPLHAWTKATIENPAKAAYHKRSFTIYVDGAEVYPQEKAASLFDELAPVVATGNIINKMTRYDTDPRHNPQPPHHG